ncbi:MAG: ATP-binding cassette domain-containing protein [Actinomycetota bacterium]
MTAAHLHVESLVVRFGDRTPLDGIDLLAQGGVIALLGANGAGKTTLLRCLATVLRPTSGVVRVDGLDPARETERIEVRRRLGYQPQDLAASPSARVFDALDYLAVLKEHPDDRRRRSLVATALDEVGLWDRRGDRVGDLSGGMRQRLGLAQAIMGSPTLLLLDEPGSGLDPEERQRLRTIVAGRRTVATTIVSTHLTDDAADADLVAVLHDRRLTFVGSPARLAAEADGRTWTQVSPPEPSTVRASWLLPDGRHRCLGTPPSGATIIPPRLEDGYLLLTDPARSRQHMS